MARKTQSRRISNYKRGYPILDRMCGVFLLVSIVGILYSMVAYANQRDSQALSQYDIQVIVDR